MRSTVGWIASVGAILFLSTPSAAWPFESAAEETSEPTPSQQDQEPPRLHYDDPLPRGMSLRSRPLLNLEHTEFHPFLGAIAFSSAFDADPTYAAGLLLRLPTSILDDHLGLWAEGVVSRVERDLPFYQPDKEGNFFLFGGGVDYEVVHSEFVFLRPQVGFLYSYFNDVNGLENGFGVLGGLSFGWHWIRFTRSVSMTLTPQVVFDGEDWMFLVTLGMGFDF
ncbi:MAG TPA: hypothetical protein VNO22_14240 [Planctomycetota bacterium]|nr:hypothetical protein [Planctomycetota bacterium]